MNTESSVISVIIPTINQVDLVVQCLLAFFASEPSAIYTYEVIVVDDGSKPEIQQNLEKALGRFPVKLLTSSQNKGFSTTVNLGVANSRGKYLCLLNNDVTCNQKNWLDIMMYEANKAQVGVVGARLLYPDGRIQHGGIIYIPQRATFDHEFRFRPGNYPPALKSGEVLGVTGALMLVNRLLWDRLGGMDEQFFISLEDVDFCLRAGEAGYRIIYTGRAVATHHEGYTRGKTPADKDPYWLSQELNSIQKFDQKWRGKLEQLKRWQGLSRKDPNRTISQQQALYWRKINHHNIAFGGFFPKCFLV